MQKFKVFYKPALRVSVKVVVPKKREPAVPPGGAQGPPDAIVILRYPTGEERPDSDDDARQVT